MSNYLFEDLYKDEKISCIVLAFNTLFNSANEKITVKFINDELDVICKVYKREHLIDVANQILNEYRKNNKFSK